MVVDSFACPACAEQIAPGRLSCPQCGTVLAAVARSWRSEPAQREPAPVIARPSSPSWLDGATTPVVPAQPADEPWTGRSDEGWDVDDRLTPSVATDAAPIPTPVAALLDASPDRWRSPAIDEQHEPDTINQDTLDDHAEAAETAEATAAADVSDDTAQDEAATDPPGSIVTDEPVDAARPAREEPAPAAARSLLRPSTRTNPFLDADPLTTFLRPAERPLLEPAEPPAWTPAAYVPPSTVAVPGTATPEPDRAVAMATADAPARILPRAWDPQAAAERATAATPPAAGASSLRRRLPVPGIDRARIDEAVGVVVLAGAMGSLIGFLLPWSRVVIGSRGDGTYFDTWGLAGQAHLFVFLLVLGALALAAIPNRVDTWLRTGVVGIALGALLLGLAWPYAFGPLGAGVGIVLVVVAASLLLLGGLLSMLVQRHGDPAPGV